MPVDGAAPDHAMDVGGSGLAAMCTEGRQPLPVDMVYASCDTVPDGGAGGAGGTARGLALDPGTYWIVIVCDDDADLELALQAEGLAPSTSVACDPSGRAVRQRIGVLAEAATTDLVSHVTGSGVTVASWLVREGKAEL
ncbi:hypothetical protein [Cellulomonas iranensis]|uniref:hypothetical protein n=1 Tax=Cellulomonas iranensis TaxID=76862 RepID=UPI003D7D2287